MRLFLFMAFMSLSSYVFAENVASSAEVPDHAVVTSAFQEPFSGEALIQLVVGLFIVVAVIFVLSWMLKRFSGISPMTKNMRVIGVLPLSTREKAVLVKVGRQHLLLGVAPGRVSRLHSFDEGDIEDTGDTAAGSFAARLAEVVQQRDKAESSSGKDDA